MENHDLDEPVDPKWQLNEIYNEELIEGLDKSLDDSVDAVWDIFDANVPYFSGFEDPSKKIIYDSLEALAEKLAERFGGSYIKVRHETNDYDEM